MNVNLNSNNIYADIYDSLAMAKADVKSGQYSEHWDVFDKQFFAKLHNPAELYDFRRCGLSRWLDDSNVESDEEKIASYYHSLIKKVGTEFYTKVSESIIGNPPVIIIEDVKADFNDLFLINFAHQVYPFVPKKEHLIIVDIGAGYGGLGAKLKKLYSSATVIIFDLPETNAIQHYYIKRNFHDAKILHYAEWKESGKTLDRATLSSYDFVILPGWLIEKISDSIVDVVINTRSMMEMDCEVIQFYFANIHRILSINGFFFCVNRYEKSTVGYPIRIKDYPYDDSWYVTLSCQSWKQPAIHVLGCVRTDYPVLDSARTVLHELKPFSYRDISVHIYSILKIMVTIVRDKLRESRIVNYFVKVTGYQKYRERSQH